MLWNNKIPARAFPAKKKNADLQKFACIRRQGYRSYLIYSCDAFDELWHLWSSNYDNVSLGGLK